MVHGMSHDHRFFSAQTPDFELRYRILLIDLRGHGMAASEAGPFGPEEYADGVLSALDDAGADAVHYWGTHTGAGAGLLLASRQPQRFRSLTLEGPVIPGDLPPYVAERLNAVREIARKEGVQRALEDWLERSAWFEVMRQHPEACRAADNRTLVMDFKAGPWLDESPPKPLQFRFEQLSRINVPVLLINGEHDHPDFIRVSDRLEAVMRNTRRAHIPGAGGFPAWEYPAPVNEVVAQFLDGLS